MNIISNFLNLFTGPRVRAAGFALTVIGGILLSTVTSNVVTLFYFLSLAIAMLATFIPGAFSWLSNFADPQFWPAFVGLGVCIILAAHVGGLFGILACIGPLTAYDGMYFEQNY